MHFIFYYGLYCILFFTTAYVCFDSLITSRKISQWRRAKIPFIKHTPLIGCKYFAVLSKQTLVSVMHKIYRENSENDLVAYFFPFIPWVLLRDPKLIRKVFAKNSDKIFCNGFQPLPSDVETQSVGFLASDKSQWKIGRNVMGPFFATSRIGGPTFAKFKTEIDKLWHYCEATRMNGQPINLKEFAFNFVADGLALWGFSENTNSYEREEELHEVVRYFFAQSPVMQVLYFVRMQFPSLQVLKPFRFIPQKYIDFVKSLLTQKVQSRRENRLRHDDVVDHFMALTENEAVDSEQPENLKGISLRQMTGYSLSLLLAGTDTVSHLCLFAAYCLSLHPEHQHRIREEISAAKKKHNVSDFTFEVIQDLQFTEQCIMETARMYPFFPLILRICSEDFQIQGTPYSIRKGERVVVCPYAMQRDPKYFKDPDKFDPERFSPQNRNSIPSDVFINFGIGPRKCPGYLVGIMMAVIFVASLVSKYEIKPRSHLHQMAAEDFDPKGFLIFPKGELLVDLIPK